MNERNGLQRKLRTEELMLENCAVWEHYWDYLGCKGIKPVYPKRNQSWMLTERTDTEGETPIMWKFDKRNDKFEKTLMLGKIEAGKEDNRWWDRRMEPTTQRISHWKKSENMQRIQKTAEWQSMGLPREEHYVLHNWKEMNEFMHAGEFRGITIHILTHLCKHRSAPLPSPL